MLQNQPEQDRFSTSHDQSQPEAGLFSRTQPIYFRVKAQPTQRKIPLVRKLYFLDAKKLYGLNFLLVLEKCRKKLLYALTDNTAD